MKGVDEGDSSAPKTVNKASKRKADGDGTRPSKKTITIPGNASPKGKSALKPSHGTGKGAMTSSGPVLESPSCLLTHKAYAIEEVGSFVKPTDLEPCDLVGTEDLGASALLILLGYVCFSLAQFRFISFSIWLTSALFSLLSLDLCQGSPRTLPCPGGDCHLCQEA